MRPVIIVAVVFTLLALIPIQAQAPSLRLIRSMSGPSGKVVGSKFIFDETRTRFVYPQDKALAIYFEWEAPAGNHALTGIWKDPEGKVTAISPDVRIQTSTSELNAYWAFELYPSTSGGIWTLEVRVDGQPGGSHSFEVVMPPPPPAPPTVEQIYRVALKSLVWIHKLDGTGRRIDTGSGFVVAKDRIATAFQVIDASAGLEIEFPGGRVQRVTDLWIWNRVQDWALIRADTQDLPALPRDDSQNSYIGERMIVLNVETGSQRTVGGVDITGRGQDPIFGERIQFSSALSAAAAGGPMFTPAGNVMGILGGSIIPGNRLAGKSSFTIPGMVDMSNGVNAATPISLTPGAVPQVPTPLKTLLDQGVFAAPVTPFASFDYGSTTTNVPRDAFGPTPRDTKEFSRKDAAVWVYTLWQKKDKSGKGSISAKVYDAQNRVRVSMPPKKVSLSAEAQTRSEISFPPRDMERGTYRVDVLWDDQVVWRTFVTVVD